MALSIATCIAPVNIAVVKYWGKSEEGDIRLIRPINSSLSGTLDMSMHSRTTVAVGSQLSSDRLWLNGKEEDVGSDRVQNCLRGVRQLAVSRGGRPAELAKCHLHVASVNNFPTAAGLASSAAGYAALVFTLAQAHGVADDPSALSAIARQGSGSACRSLYGGFVKWNKGTRLDGLDSVAEQVVSEDHWPEMQVLVLVVSDKKKTTSSTAGMQTSVRTSELLKYRAEHIVEGRMAEMEKALHARDFGTFAKITMQDSNQFHAICLDTYPPISYMNDVSRAVITLITHYNAQFSSPKAAYTFDAGPNAVIYALKDTMAELIPLVHHFFPSTDDAHEYYHGNHCVSLAAATATSPLQAPLEAARVVPAEPGSLRYILHTGVGCGPKVVDDPAKCLLREDGQPK